MGMGLHGRNPIRRRHDLETTATAQVGELRIGSVRPSETPRLPAASVSLRGVIRSAEVTATRQMPSRVSLLATILCPLHRSQLLPFPVQPRCNDRAANHC